MKRRAPARPADDDTTTPGAGGCAGGAGSAASTAAFACASTTAAAHRASPPPPPTPAQIQAQQDVDLLARLDRDARGPEMPPLLLAAYNGDDQLSGCSSHEAIPMIKGQRATIRTCCTSRLVQEMSGYAAAAFYHRFRLGLHACFAEAEGRRPADTRAPEPAPPRRGLRRWCAIGKPLTPLDGAAPRAAEPPRLRRWRRAAVVAR